MPCKGTAAVLRLTTINVCVQAIICGTVYAEGVGLGCIAAGAKQITPDVMLAAAKAAAVKLTAEELQQGSILPQVDRIRYCFSYIKHTLSHSPTWQSSKMPMLSTTKQHVVSSALTCGIQLCRTLWQHSIDWIAVQEH